MTLSGLILPLTVLAGYLVFVWWLWREVGGTPLARTDSVRTWEPALRPHNAPQRVLFVCTHNSARSQMAEALLRRAAGTHFIVASAGTAPTRVHPLAEEVMAERGLRLYAHRAKAFSDVGLRWDYVITVCDAAYEQCPEFPEKTSRLHWSIADPSKVSGTPEQQLEAFRRVRDDLEERITRWVADQTEKG